MTASGALSVDPCGAVYRCAPGCDALETWLPARTFYSAQGMVISPDGRRLYVADYRNARIRGVTCAVP